MTALSHRFPWRGLALAGMLAVTPGLARAAEHGHVLQQIIVPGEDRFTPFALTIEVGDTVEWVNNDTDDHTVVSDDVFNTTGPVGFNRLLPGTDSNGGQPGKLRIRFRHPGTFVYFCRFHSKLNGENQPVAPGPKGGIQGEGSIPPGNSDNWGTPMMGTITVLGEHD